MRKTTFADGAKALKLKGKDILPSQFSTCCPRIIIGESFEQASDSQQTSYNGCRNTAQHVYYMLSMYNNMASQQNGLHQS